MSLRSKLDLLNDPYIYKFKGSITYKNGILPLESRHSAKKWTIKRLIKIFYQICQTFMPCWIFCQVSLLTLKFIKVYFMKLGFKSLSITKIRQNIWPIKIFFGKHNNDNTLSFKNMVRRIWFFHWIRRFFQMLSNMEITLGILKWTLNTCSNAIESVSKIL